MQVREVRTMTMSGERIRPDLVDILRGILRDEVPVAMALQPITEPATGRVIGYEALFRVLGRHDVVPAELWAEAHKHGLLDQLEDRVAWLCARLRRKSGHLFVNADTRSSGIAGRWSPLRDVVVELSEIAVATDAVVRELEAEHLAYALDDVGTGAANFGALARMQPTFLKIDRSIVSGCDQDERKARVVAMLVRYARDVGSEVIAEGVETEGEAAKLVELDVRYAQGYLFGRPEIVEPVDEGAGPSSA